MTAPRTPDLLPLYIDQEFERLRNDLEERYRPIFVLKFDKAAALVAGTFDWGVLVVPLHCNLFALSLALTGSTARAQINIERDGTVETDYALDLASSNEGYIEFPKPLEFFPGSRLRVQTVSQANTAATNTALAWLRTA